MKGATGEDGYVIIEADEDLILHLQIGGGFIEAQFNGVVDRIGNHNQHHDQCWEDVEIIYSVCNDLGQQPIFSRRISHPYSTLRSYTHDDASLMGKSDRQETSVTG